ncbi:hypothetical protein PUMCH_004951 [Australozyma saopauloensis]|uniref:Uncharacterized protein n=1 Tax=Australozyma saopauloensis TaxID=291208 RepID=A0AAX4HGD1_9ASCO|nr:hypothetical protein PUMCH_004951 [[Candida] saopauloensis]
MFVVTIQNSFEDVINDVETGNIASESFWVARRDATIDELQQYFSVEVSLDGNKSLKFNGKAENPLQTFDFKPLSESLYSVTITEKNQSSTYTLKRPTLKYPVSEYGLITLAVGLESGLEIILGTLNGNISFYDTSEKKALTTLAEAHYSTVTHLGLFPSEKVLLSVGDDLCIHLWDLVNINSLTKPTRTFMKHKKTITDAALIGRGRNFVTSSEDGSVIVWECSTGNAVSIFRRITDHSDIVKCVAIATSSSEPLENQFRPELLFDCKQQVVFAGYELGLVQQYSIAQNCATEVKHKRDYSVSSICAIGDFLITGYEDGIVQVWDWVKNTVHLLSLCENHPVTHLRGAIESSELLQFELSNGPEVLLSVVFNKNSGQVETTYLVGFMEMFQVLLVAANCISTEEEVAVF